MLNNIKISQRADEIVLNINIIAEMHEIIEELEETIIEDDFDDGDDNSAENLEE